jgi:DNA-binding transcriptional LysR family regulator
MENRTQAKHFYRCFTFFILLLAACSALQTEAPPPTPQPIKVAMPPELQPLREALYTCAAVQPHIALIVDEAPALSAFDRDADLSLRLSIPPEGSWYAAPLAWEKISVILHPSNPVRSLDLESLHALFTGQILNWAEAGGEDQDVQVWVLSPDHTTRLVFDAAILQKTPVIPDARVAPDPKIMQDAVANDTGAIGYLPGGWLTSQMHAVALSNTLEAGLRLPVLGLAPMEPQGVLREFFLCLQIGEGQAEILGHYQAYKQ